MNSNWDSITREKGKLEMEKGMWQEFDTFWLSLIPQHLPASDQGNQDLNQEESRDQEEMKVSEEWQKLHIGRITGRNASIAAGHIRYTEDDLPENVALGILGQRQRRDTEQSKKRMKLGNIAEPLVKKWYSQTYKKEIQEVGLAVWKQDLHLGASADGFIDNLKGEGIIEVKYKEELPSTLKFQAQISQRKGDGSSEICKSFSHVPRRDFDQMQHTMAITGKKFCDYVVFVPEVGIYDERIPFQSEYFQQELLQTYQKFKTDYLLPLMEKYQVEMILPSSEA